MAARTHLVLPWGCPCEAPQHSGGVADQLLGGPARRPRARSSPSAAPGRAMGVSHRIAFSLGDLGGGSAGDWRVFGGFGGHVQAGCPHPRRPRAALAPLWLGLAGPGHVAGTTTGDLAHRDLSPRLRTGSSVFRTRSPPDKAAL